MIINVHRSAVAELMIGYDAWQPQELRAEVCTRRTASSSAPPPSPHFSLSGVTPSSQELAGRAESGSMRCPLPVQLTEAACVRRKATFVGAVKPPRSVTCQVPQCGCLLTSAYCMRHRCA